MTGLRQLLPHLLVWHFEKSLNSEDPDFHYDDLAPWGIISSPHWPRRAKSREELGPLVGATGLAIGLMPLWRKGRAGAARGLSHFSVSVQFVCRDNRLNPWPNSCGRTFAVEEGIKFELDSPWTGFSSWLLRVLSAWGTYPKKEYLQETMGTVHCRIFVRRKGGLSYFPESLSFLQAAGGVSPQGSIEVELETKWEAKSNFQRL